MILKEFLISHDDNRPKDFSKPLLHWDMCAIINLYEYYFEPFKTNFRRLIVECVKKIENDRIIIGSGFCEVFVELDLDYYATLSKLEKKKIILEKLQEGVRKVVKAEGFDPAPFEYAYKPPL